MTKKVITFGAKVIAGSNRGKSLSVPTLNLDRSQVPEDLAEGIYACFVECSGKQFPAAMHLGPRPVFGDTPSCEVHIIDRHIARPPKEVHVQVIANIRDIENFKTPEALILAMQADIVEARGILALYETYSKDFRS